MREKAGKLKKVRDISDRFQLHILLGHLENLCSLHFPRGQIIASYGFEKAISEGIHKIKQMDVVFGDDLTMTRLISTCLEKMPMLESLKLNINSRIEELAALTTYIQEAPNLIEVHLLFSRFEGEFTQSLANCLVSICNTKLVHVIIDVMIPNGSALSFDSEKMQTFLSSDHSLSTFSCPVDSEAKEAATLSPDLKGIRLLAFNKKTGNNRHEKCQFMRSESEWTEFVAEAQSLCQNARLLSCTRFKSSSKLPREVVEHIITFGIAQNSNWKQCRVDTIRRCLMNRKTLGLVRSEVVDFDPNVLFVKCLHALKQLESQETPVQVSIEGEQI